MWKFINFITSSYIISNVYNYGTDRIDICNAHVFVYITLEEHYHLNYESLKSTINV